MIKKKIECTKYEIETRRGKKFHYVVGDIKEYLEERGITVYEYEKLFSGVVEFHVTDEEFNKFKKYLPLDHDFTEEFKRAVTFSTDSGIYYMTKQEFIDCAYEVKIYE